MAVRTDRDDSYLYRVRESLFSVSDNHLPKKQITTKAEVFVYTECVFLKQHCYASLNSRLAKTPQSP